MHETQNTSVNQAVVLLSGGMDSTTLLYYVKRTLNVATIHALSFDYGQRHAREIEAARWQARAAGVTEHCVMDVSLLGGVAFARSVLTDREADLPNLDDMDEAQRSQPPTYVPHRNLVLLSLAAAYAEAHGIADVFYGAQAQDRYGYWD